MEKKRKMTDETVTGWDTLRTRVEILADEKLVATRIFLGTISRINE